MKFYKEIKKLKVFKVVIPYKYKSVFCFHGIKLFSLVIIHHKSFLFHFSPVFPVQIKLSIIVAEILKRGLKAFDVRVVFEVETAKTVVKQRSLQKWWWENNGMSYHFLLVLSNLLRHCFSVIETCFRYMEWNLF